MSSEVFIITYLRGELNRVDICGPWNNLAHSRLSVKARKQKMIIDCKGCMTLVMKHLNYMLAPVQSQSSIAIFCLKLLPDHDISESMGKCQSESMSKHII